MTVIYSTLCCYFVAFYVQASANVRKPLCEIFLSQQTFEFEMALSWSKSTGASLPIKLVMSVIKVSCKDLLQQLLTATHSQILAFNSALLFFSLRNLKAKFTLVVNNASTDASSDRLHRDFSGISLL